MALLLKKRKRSLALDNKSSVGHPKKLVYDPECPVDYDYIRKTDVHAGLVHILMIFETDFGGRKFQDKEDAFET